MQLQLKLYLPSTLPPLSANTMPQKTNFLVYFTFYFAICAAFWRRCRRLRGTGGC